MNTYHIENWGTWFGSLLGQRVEDNKPVTTSNVQRVEGNVAYTKNSAYVLGKPSQGFVEYCTNEGIMLDLDNFESTFELLGCLK